MPLNCCPCRAASTSGKFAWRGTTRIIFCRQSQWPTLVAKSFTGLLNLSKATRLKEVSFICRSGPSWVLAALQTTTPDHRDPQQISIIARWILFSLDPDLVDSADFRRPLGESAYQEWSEVDRLLTQLLELRQIRLKVLYSFLAFITRKKRNLRLRVCCQRSLRGTVEAIGGCDMSFL